MHSQYQPLHKIAFCLCSCLLSPVIGRCISIWLYCWWSHWSESIKMLFSHGLERCLAFVLLFSYKEKSNAYLHYCNPQNQATGDNVGKGIWSPNLLKYKNWNHIFNRLPHWWLLTSKVTARMCKNICEINTGNKNIMCKVTKLVVAIPQTTTNKTWTTNDDWGCRGVYKSTCYSQWVSSF